MTSYPSPAGWRILLRIKDVENKTKSGIILPETTKEEMQLAMNVAQVVAVGPDAYKDMDKFRSPWCKEGDWVLIGKYSGVKFKCGNEDMRILNDDEIVAVLPDPSVIAR